MACLACGSQGVGYRSSCGAFLCQRCASRPCPACGEKYDALMLNYLPPQVEGTLPAPAGSRFATPPPPPQVIYRETIVVKVPCKHCGYLNLNTDSRCSSCGAPTR